MTMGRSIEPQQYIKKSKHLDRLDEAFGYICIHISRDLLFHLEGIRTMEKVWDKLESLFGKQDEIRGHILENEKTSLQPSNFNTILQFFSKFKSLVFQCKQCGIEKKDEQLVLSIMSKLGSEFSIFVSNFHSWRLSIPNWTMPSVDAFAAGIVFLNEERRARTWLVTTKSGIAMSSNTLSFLTLHIPHVARKGMQSSKKI